MHACSIVAWRRMIQYVKRKGVLRRHRVLQRDVEGQLVGGGGHGKAAWSHWYGVGRTRRVLSRTGLVLASLALGLACLASCGRNEAEIPWVQMPQPEMRRVGERESRFFFSYVLRGGYFGGKHQRLIVTTDAELATPKVFGQYLCRGVTFRHEVYVVDGAVAAELDGLLSERGFFDWMSTTDTSGSDNYAWEVLVTSDAGAHTVVLCDMFDSEVSRQFFRADLPSDTDSDNELALLAGKFFALVVDVREIAAEKGERIRPVGESDAEFVPELWSLDLAKAELGVAEGK